jgi:hypothetical protein
MPVRAALVEAGVNILDRTVSRALLQMDKRFLAGERQEQMQDAHNMDRN